MIIDFHTHIFPDKIAPAAIEKLSAASNTAPFTDGTEAGLKGSMKEAGVSLSVVLPVATNPQKVSKINESSARYNARRETSEERGIIHFGCIHPLCECAERELEYAASLGLRGIKIHPVYQDTFIHDEKFIRILSKAGELGLIVVTHAGDDIGFPGTVKCSPQMIREAVDTAGPVELVLAHMGGWQNWDTVCSCLADTNVYIDTSFSLGEMSIVDKTKTHPEKRELLHEESFVKIVRTFGSRRVLFGTDSPWGSQSETVAAINRLPLTDEEKQNIFEKNAARLLNMC